MMRMNVIAIDAQVDSRGRVALDLPPAFRSRRVNILVSDTPPRVESWRDLSPEAWRAKADALIGCIDDETFEEPPSLPPSHIEALEQ